MPVGLDEQEEGGEGYFASISDLMVGILFVFLLMLAVFALAYSDPSKENEVADLRQRIAELESEHDRLRADMEVSTTALTAEQARAIHLTAALDGSRREVAWLRVQLDRSTQALAAEQARVTAQELQLISAAAQVARLQAELDRLMALVNPREQALLMALLEDLVLVERELSALSDEGRLQRLRRALLEDVRRRLALRDVQVEVSAQHDVLRLPSAEMFRLGTPDFTPRGRDQAGKLLEELSALLPCYASRAIPSPDCPAPFPAFETVLIEGHTDTLRADNWRLSANRALAVMDLMVGPSAGLRGLRNAADQPLIGLAGYGETRTLPGIADTDPRNRRIELRFLLATPNAADIAALRARVGQIRERLDALQARP